MNDKLKEAMARDFIGHEFCEHFHKVDLGDAPLTHSKTIQCRRCGKRYLVKPRDEK